MPLLDKVVNSVGGPALGKTVSQTPILLCPCLLDLLFKAPLIPRQVDGLANRIRLLACRLFLLFNDFTGFQCWMHVESCNVQGCLSTSC